MNNKKFKNVLALLLLSIITATIAQAQQVPIKKETNKTDSIKQPRHAIDQIPLVPIKSSADQVQPKTSMPAKPEMKPMPQEYKSPGHPANNEYDGPIIKKEPLLPKKQI